MRVSVFETEEWEHEACKRLEPTHVVSCTSAFLDVEAASTHAGAEVITTFFHSRLDAEVLALFPALRLISTRSTGYDHIDLEYCQAHDITVCNVPDYGDSTVAEHAFALLLTLSRNVVEAVERTKLGDFSQSGLRGFELRGKTLGVIGTGRIGRRAIEIGIGFGMHVVAFDLKPDEPAALALGFQYRDLTGVLETADVIMLHVPANRHTQNLISDEEFAAMKRGAVLINTARGSIVDIPALLRALSGQRLRAVGLDVLPAEPLLRDEAQIFRAARTTIGSDLSALLANHALLRYSNVLITPHIAFDTDEALRRIIDTTLANIDAYARGEPQNVVCGPGESVHVRSKQIPPNWQKSPGRDIV